MQDPRSARVLSAALLGERSIILNGRKRTAAIAISALSGFATYAVFEPHVGGTWLLLAGAFVLGVPSAVTKSATACGVNALGTFSRYDRPVRFRLGGSLLYLLTAGLTGATVGSVVGALGLLVSAQSFLLVAAPVFILLGLQEVGALGRIVIPTSRWQVPSEWVRNDRLAPIVWGLFLGSGVATWMPYASFYGLLLLAALLPAPVGIALMALYGVARAVPAVLAAISPRFGFRVVMDRTLDLRLLGHATGGLTSIAFGGLMLAWSVNQARTMGLQGWPTVDPRSLFAGTIAVGGGLFFSASGLGKLISLRSVGNALHETYHVPGSMASAAAIALVVVELVCAGLLLWPTTRLAGLVTGAILASVFAAAAMTALVTGAQGDCGCLGALKPERLGRATVMRALGIGGLLLAASIASTPLGSLDLGPRAVPVLLTIVAAGAGAVVLSGMVASLANVLRVQRAADE